MVSSDYGAPHSLERTAAPARPYTAKVTAYLRDCKDLRTAQRDRAAEAVGCWRQTVSKMLTAEGTSFPDLLMRERRRRCDTVLAKGGRPRLSEIADACGLMHPCSASRSFRTWYGISLVEYLRNKRHGC